MHSARRRKNVASQYSHISPLAEEQDKRSSLPTTTSTSLRNGGGGGRLESNNRHATRRDFLFRSIVSLVILAVAFQGLSLVSKSDRNVWNEQKMDHNDGDPKAKGGFWLEGVSKALNSFQTLGNQHSTIVFLEDLQSDGYPAYSFQKNLPSLSDPDKADRVSPDIVMQSLMLADQEHFQRYIRLDDGEIVHRERDLFLDAIDISIDPYYYHFDEIPNPRECIRPQWAYKVYPTCNIFHEYRLDRANMRHNRDIVDYDVEFIASGYYRDTWALQEGYHAAFVLKRLRFRDEFNFDHRRMVRTHVEALVLERLSHSDVVADIYGHCGTSVSVERAYQISPEIITHLPLQRRPGRLDQSKLDEMEALSSGGVVSFNKWAVPQKLSMPIDMVTALTEMHNYAGGVMIHDDIKIDQWLRAEDGRFILGDVNNAVVLNWNSTKQEYCKFYISYGGVLRGPEEFEGADIDESADIWPTGFLIFAVLSGLWPYYTTVDEDEIQEQVINGIPPYLNPKFKTRTFIEGRLVHLMTLCFKKDPRDRATMSEILQHLLETKRLYLAKDE